MVPPPLRETLRIDAKTSVTVAADRPAAFRPGVTPALVLAPGAGSDLDTPLLIALERALAPEILVVRFNFPYREEGRGVPDAQKKLEATYGAVLAWLGAHPELRPGPLFAGGKSMGGRIASHLAAAGVAAAGNAAAGVAAAGNAAPGNAAAGNAAPAAELAGLVLLGYPLHPAGAPSRLRAAHLARIRCPILFIQGERDALCRLDLFAPVRAGLAAPNRLLVIADGDHSFKVPKRTGRSEAEITAEISAAVAAFILGPRP